MFKQELESFMENLYEIGSVKFGEFYLSSGLKTPVYFDLRLIVSHPKVLSQAGRLIKKYIEENNLEYDIICGVPYGAFAVATVGKKLYLNYIVQVKKFKAFSLFFVRLSVFRPINQWCLREKSRKIMAARKWSRARIRRETLVYLLKTWSCTARV